jgi:endo-1,4-beta-D-glucanase Y
MWMAAVKNDYFVTEIERQKTILTSDFIAAQIKQNLDQLAFKHFFGQNVTLVPIPKSF